MCVPHAALKIVERSAPPWRTCEKPHLKGARRWGSAIGSSSASCLGLGQRQLIHRELDGVSSGTRTQVVHARLQAFLHVTQQDMTDCTLHTVCSRYAHHLKCPIVQAALCSASCKLDPPIKAQMAGWPENFTSYCSQDCMESTGGTCRCLSLEPQALREARFPA